DMRIWGLSPDEADAHDTEFTNEEAAGFDPHYLPVGIGLVPLLQAYELDLFEANVMFQIVQCDEAPWIAIQIGLGAPGGMLVWGVHASEAAAIESVGLQAVDAGEGIRILPMIPAYRW
ncbi:MAG: hypothetical protein ACR2J9_08800, partial [Gaiellales bacterium]